MPEHPYPEGTRVYHYVQQWHRSWMGGMATVVRSVGPYSDESYEYIVMAGQDISRQTGPDNPETREAQWSSFMTYAVKQDESL